MEIVEKSNKASRVLEIYTKLINGNWINKAEEACNYGVNEKSIQRDIEEIRNFLEEKGNATVIYDPLEKGYRLEKFNKMKLSNPEILAICKILLDSRAFTKVEMESMLERLVECCIPEQNQKLVGNLIRNELFHYIEPRHKTEFVDTMWEIGQAIQKQRYIEIEYQRNKDKAMVKRKLKPAAIMFSEFYFYMAAFLDDEDESRKHFENIDDAFPTIYRIDRIKKLVVTEEHFYMPYANRFEEGEFRKRIQFMYGGKLRKIRFKYTGLNVESVLDRLPTARILSDDKGEYVIQAEVFGDGVDMWLKSQENFIERI